MIACIPNTGWLKDLVCPSVQINFSTENSTDYNAIGHYYPEGLTLKWLVIASYSAQPSISLYFCISPVYVSWLLSLQQLLEIDPKIRYPNKSTSTCFFFLNSRSWFFSFNCQGCIINPFSTDLREDNSLTTLLFSLRIKYMNYLSVSHLK